MKRTTVIMCIFVISILVSGCKKDNKDNTEEISAPSQSNSPNTVISVNATHETTKVPYDLSSSPTPQSLTTPQDISSAVQKNPSTSLNNLDSWVGNYEYSEYLPPNINRLYSITVFRKDNDYFATIHLDGYQTLQRLEANVTGDENYIELKFERYLPENVFDSYKVGDTLLRFEKQDSEIITIWGAITPFDESKKSGNLLFNKVGNQNKLDPSIRTQTSPKNDYSVFEIYQAILLNKDTFNSTDGKETVYLNDFLTNEKIFETRLKVKRFTVLDLDADKIPEVVLQLTPVENPNPDFYEILHYMDGSVHGYIKGNREFNNLKTDGVFSFSGSASYNGYGKLRFESNACEVDRLGFKDRSEDDNTAFFINDKPVTEEAYNSFRDDEDEKKDAIWYEFSQKNIETELSQYIPFTRES